MGVYLVKCFFKDSILGILLWSWERSPCCWETLSWNAL